VSFPEYPINDYGPLMKGIVIGALGIFHVFIAQFAIGGGMLMCYFQWLAARGRCPPARRFLDGYFKVIVLVSFVVGALTGVGMWFTAIQISPRTIGMMVNEFHWVWATEWTFFCLEIVSGYAFYRCAARLTDVARMFLLVVYSLAAWFSLFWINGILSWQLTPGRWVETRDVWAGFFNPSFFPSLLYRTVTSITIASLAACVVINFTSGLGREERSTLVHRAAHFLAPMVFMPALGVWFLWSMPEDSRSWILGGSPALTLFLGLAIGASLLIGLYAMFGLLYQRLYINGATAALLVSLALVASAGGEFVREGARKPYSIREVLYSNSIAPQEVERMRLSGCTLNNAYAFRGDEGFPNPLLRTGSGVFRVLCSVCHTIDGINGLVHLAGPWSIDQRRMNIAKLQHTKTFMPPFAGSAWEVEAVAQWIGWNAAGRPETWPASAVDNETLHQIKQWLDEAGTMPGGTRSKLENLSSSP